MYKIKIVDDNITLEELKKIASEIFVDMVKAVVDVEKKIMAVGGELHADEEAILLNHGSKQQNLWGINIYVDKPRASWIEFDSMINIRPIQNNRSRSVESISLQNNIVKIVNSLIH